MGPHQNQTDPVELEEQDRPAQEVATPFEQPAVTTTQQQIDQAPTPARQTCSGRVVRNTARYDQSVDQRNQGLVAWEIMIDQDGLVGRRVCARKGVFVYAQNCCDIKIMTADRLTTVLD